MSALDLANDGGFVIVGNSQSSVSGDKSENNIGIIDYWIVKTDSIGTMQWQNTIGGTKEDQSHKIVATKDGGYIIAGESDLFPISGDKTEANMDSANYFQGFVPWIVRLDSAGNIKWQNTLQNSYTGIYGWDMNVLDIVETRNHDFVTAEYSEFYAVWTTEYIEGLMRRITETLNTISGTIYVDANSNGVQNIGEKVLYNHKIIDNNTNRFAFSLIDGSYSFVVLDSGNFTVSTPIPNFYTSAPLTNTAYFNGFRQIDSLNNFAFQPLGVVNDLWVIENGTSRLRPGFNGMYTIQYGNSGTTTLSPSIVLYLDPLLTYSYSDSIPFLVTADSIVWNLAPLAPFESGTIKVVFGISFSSDWHLCSFQHLHIYPFINDTIPTSNSHTCHDPISSGSYDPNDILVNKEQLTTTEVSYPTLFRLPSVFKIPEMILLSTFGSAIPLIPTSYNFQQ